MVISLPPDPVHNHTLNSSLWSCVWIPICPEAQKSQSLTLSPAFFGCKGEMIADLLWIMLKTCSYKLTLEILWLKEVNRVLLFIIYFKMYHCRTTKQCRTCRFLVHGFTWEKNDALRFLMWHFLLPYFLKRSCKEKLCVGHLFLKALPA